MTDSTEPKRKRVYTGDSLERRRAYQREYNQKKRDEAKMANRKPATASQQFTLVTAKDDVYKAIAKAEAKGKTRARDIAEELERDKANAGADWNDSNLEFFSQFKPKAGE